MLGLFYIISIFLCGLSLASCLRLRLHHEERTVAGLVLGQVAGVWILYIIATLMGRLSYLAIILTSLIFLLPSLASVFLPFLSKKKLSEYWHEFFQRKHYSTEFLILLSFLTLFFILLDLHAILPADSMGNLYTTEHVWADTPFHVSIINSFIYRDNFPPNYPIILNTPLHYPFLIDLHTAALIKAGMTLRQGIVFSNILLQVPIFLLIYLIAQELGGSRRVGLLASLVFLLLGNFGFLLAFKDISRSGDFSSWLSHLPWGYTGSSLGVESRESIGLGLYLGNPTYLFFMPRRAVIFGVAVSLTLMLILLKLVQNKEKTHPCTNNEATPYINGSASYLPFIASGLLLGLLPRIHSHSFLVMTVFTGFLLISRRWWHHKPYPVYSPLPSGIGGTVNSEGANPPGITVPGHFDRDFYVKGALLLVVAIIVALPQLSSLREQVSNNFFKFWPGWIGEAHAALAGLGKANFNIAWLAQSGDAAIVFLKFWLWNAGLLLLLLPLALWHASRNQLIFYFPFILIFILGNLVKIQPWEWDNNNLFLYWQLGTVFVVILWLGRYGNIERSVKYGLFSLAIAVLIAGGVLNIIRTSQERLLLWGVPDVKIAEWVRDNTPPDSIFLTGSAHNHPIPSLAGRQIVMGFEGWLFSHSLSYEKVLRDETIMFQGDMSLLKKYGIDYVALTPYERAFAEARGFTLNESFLRNPDMFELVYREYDAQGVWEIYHVRKP